MQNIFPLLYLLLKRDIEIFEYAKTEKLDRDELWDAADNILRVHTAVMSRYKDLRSQSRHFANDCVYQLLILLSSPVHSAKG